ncbi:hypothetical protein ACR9YC_05740 [Parasphingorhabdus sp. DH2-15]|uniref:hypothetical protein n=1 Tax=Parasphingorhabdus sp. DH2-15 TaxID=3444112 RepID=UPI003F687020
MTQSKDSLSHRHPRIVHILGGLRAVDFGRENVTVAISPEIALLKFPTPEFSQLYRYLNNLNLVPIGVEFPNSLTAERKAPADWQSLFTNTGHLLMTERRAWSEIRHYAAAEANEETFRVASKCATYLDLINIRLFQLSNAYNRTLNGRYLNGWQANHLCSDGFMGEIDAAVHAFAADSGSFRDLIAEIVWRYILKENATVTTLGTFIKKSKNHDNGLAQEILTAADDGGWLKSLSNLRDSIVHIAPFGMSDPFHEYQVRELILNEATKIPRIHYPLLKKSGTVYTKEEAFPPNNDEDSFHKMVSDYNSFVNESIDGLTYAWQQIERLGSLLSRVRIATDLKHKPITITDDDVVGDIKVHTS